MPEQVTRPPTFNDLSYKTFTRARDIVQPHLLPLAGKMIISGEPKVGKSFIVLRLLRDLASGGTLFGCPMFVVPEPVKCLLFEQEVGEQPLKARMLDMFAGAPMDVRERVSYESKDTSLQLDRDQGFKTIYTKTELVRPDVVVFDPISKFHTRNENSAQEVGIVAKRLDRIAERLGPAIILIHHFSYPTVDGFRGVGTRSRGSSVFAADPDSILEVDRIRDSPDKRWWKVSFKLRQMQEPSPMVLVWDKKAMDIHFDHFLP